MKKLMILSGLMVALVVSVFGQDILASLNSPDYTNDKEAKFNWTETVYDFGKIEKGVPATHKFSFTNVGENSLVITTVKAGCGCTVTEYSKEPIEAGGEGFVKATYNAAKVGQFSKTVTINANTEGGTVVLTIKGEVVETRPEGSN